MQQLLVWRLSTGTVFKLVGLGLVCSMVPFAFLMGLLAMFGADTLTWNDQPKTGISALLISPFIGVFVAAIFSAIGGCAMSFGLWAYSMFRPVSLSYLACDAPPDHPSFG